MKLIYKKDPLGQLNRKINWIETYFKRILNEMKVFKFFQTMKIICKKQKFGKQEEIYKTAFFKSKTATIIDDIETEKDLQLSIEQFF